MVFSNKIGYLTIDYKNVGGVSVLSEITESLLKTRFSLVKRNINNSVIENFCALRSCDRIIFSVGNASNMLNYKVLIYVILFFFIRKKIIFRGFAGGLRYKFSKYQLLKLKVISYFFNVITFETLADTVFFRKIFFGYTKVLWLPNHRSYSLVKEKSRLDEIAYFGRITKSKGLENLVAYSRKLNKKAVAFGPIDDGYAVPDGIVYKGTIEHLDVNDRMREYKYIFLHSSWPTEGYPGVLLEAFINGCSVITNLHNDMTELFATNNTKEVEVRKFKKSLLQLFDKISYLNKWKILLDL